MLERLGGEFAESLKQVRGVVCEGEAWEVKEVVEKLRGSTGEEWEGVYGRREWSEVGGGSVLYHVGERGGVVEGEEGIGEGVTLHLLDGGLEPTGVGAGGEI
jgi:hypothetical protein